MRVPDKLCKLTVDSILPVAGVSQAADIFYTIILTTKLEVTVLWTTAPKKGRDLTPLAKCMYRKIPAFCICNHDKFLCRFFVDQG